MTVIRVNRLFLQFFAVAGEEIYIEFDIVTEDICVDMLIDGMGAAGFPVIEDAGKAVDAAGRGQIAVIAGVRAAGHH